MGSSDEDSFAYSIAGHGHWALSDCIAIISSSHKKTGSTEGHALAGSSPFQAARVEDAPRRIEICRSAILKRDFEAFASIVELDSDMMHAVMMTSQPALHYWLAASLAVMQAVREWREGGLSACYTVDAGANVHVLCPEKEAEEVAIRLRKISGVKDVLTANVGGAARIVEEE
jgi:diphosphomevalonate decarboxylase